jgi:hypothetical protein
MKLNSLARLSFPIASAIAALLAAALPLASHAAPVTWGSVQALTGSTNIVSTGVSNLAGANFGITTGTTTTVNNGVGETGGVDVEFKSLRSGQSATLSNGITVAAASTWGNWGTGGNTAVTGNFGFVLSSNLGLEVTPPASATITLSGLTNGTQYQIQFFADSTGNNSQTISGSGSMNSLNGQFVTGTFTADATFQVLDVSYTTGDFCVANALTIGAVSGPDTTPPTISSLSPLDNASGVAVGTNLVVTFSEAIHIGTGDITLKNLTDSTQTTITLPNAQVSVAGAVLTINPTADLTAGKDYAIQIASTAIKDLASTPNFFAGIADDTTWNFTSADIDTTAPDWIATWPQAEQLSPTSLTVRAKINEAGTAYYVVLAYGATAPSAAQVKALTDSNGAPVSASGSLALTANTEATAPVTGLTADSTYDVYFVAEDAVPNLQVVPSMVSVSLVPPAVVTWGTWTAVTDNTAIQVLGGYTTVEGVNFNGSTTTINNGPSGIGGTNVQFIGIAQNASGSAAGITVGSSNMDFASTSNNNSNVSSAIGSPQIWGTVLDRVIGDFGSGAEITLSGLTNGSQYYVQFFSANPDGNGQNTMKISSGGVDSPLFGTHTGGQTRYIIATFTANGSSQLFSPSGGEPHFSALVIGGNTFAGWIGGFTGLNGLTGFNDDADFDGLDNGLENFLGTAPNVGNAGLSAGTLSGNTFTFTHPQNATPASDVSAPAYTWSTDLETFHASGASADGITVNLVAVTNNPIAGTTTVTATVTGTVPSKLFVRLGVTQK